MLSKLAGDSASFEEVDEPPNFVAATRLSRAACSVGIPGRLGVRCLAMIWVWVKPSVLLALAEMDIQNHLDAGDGSAPDVAHLSDVARRKLAARS